MGTANTEYYRIAKYLPPLLNPLTENKFSLKDSFEASKRDVPGELFYQDYKYITLDVTSLYLLIKQN